MYENSLVQAFNVQQVALSLLSDSYSSLYVCEAPRWIQYNHYYDNCFLFPGTQQEQKTTLWAGTIGITTDFTWIQTSNFLLPDRYKVVRLVIRCVTYNVAACLKSDMWYTLIQICFKLCFLSQEKYQKFDFGNYEERKEWNYMYISRVNADCKPENSNLWNQKRNRKLG